MKDILGESTRALRVLAGVNEIKESNTGKSIEFDFKNSLKANYCQIVEYHDKYIMQLRKKYTYDGKDYNQLVYESVIREQEIQDTFEAQTGIYLSYLDAG
jgi:hypothetical protein